jgi:hypothetical protein
MPTPKAKGQILSVGAKTYIDSLAKQHVYGYTKQITTKEMQKGIVVEPQSIALLNEVLFTNFTKNEQRFENELIAGTPDIITSTHVYDTKSSWSLNTFPATVEDAQNNDYEWQLRGYMMLCNINYAEVAFCMVDTPDELIGFEEESAHRVSHIDPLLRVTRVKYERDAGLESVIKQKCEAAQEYFEEAVEAIRGDHR